MQAWCPWYVKDIDLLESIQKRALNMVVGLNSTSYEDKLKETCLPSLQERRVCGDMIQTWKYVHGVNPRRGKTYQEGARFTQQNYLANQKSV